MWISINEKKSSDNAKGVSVNCNNSKSTDEPQVINDFEQNLITSLKNRMLLLESENRLLADDTANKQRFTETSILTKATARAAIIKIL